MTEPNGCAVCGDGCAAPLAPVAEAEHLWCVPWQHGLMESRTLGDAESCAKCSKMRGTVNESRPCKGPVKMSPTDWFR